MAFKAVTAGYNQETTGPREAELVIEVPDDVLDDAVADESSVVSGSQAGSVIRHVRATISEEAIRFYAKRFGDLVASWDAPEKGYYGAVTVEGADLTDVADAVTEAGRRISGGFTSGKDGNASSRFWFDLTEADR